MLGRQLHFATFHLLLVCGCSQAPVMWHCEFGEESGSAVLDTEVVRIVFEGVRIAHTQGREGGGSSGSMQVSGSGTSQIVLTALGRKLTNAYSAGINTVTLGEYELRITDGGRKLVVGSTTYEIGNGKKTILIHGDGSADVSEPK